MKVKVAKNRVQPANSHQTECFVFEGHDEGRIGGSPHFSFLHDSCHELLGVVNITAAAVHVDAVRRLRCSSSW